MRLLPSFEDVQNDIVKASENIPFVFLHKPTLHFLIICNNTVVRFATIYKKGNAGYDILLETFGCVCFRAYVHRIIAHLFVQNSRPDIFDRVDHIDRNKKNNAPSNLRWVNHRLNMINRTDTNVRERVYFRKNGKQSTRWKKCFGEYAYIYSDTVIGDLVRIRVYFNNFNEAVEFASKDKVRRFDKLYQSYINASSPPRGETPGREGEVHSGPLPRFHDAALRPATNRSRYCRFA